MKGLPTRGELVQLEFVRREKNRKKNCECKDARFLIDEQNDSVECTICGALVTYKFALCKMADLDARRNAIMKQMLEQAEEIEKYKPYMKILKRLEQFARRGDVVPTCPSCNEPFLLDELIHWVGKTFVIDRINKRIQKEKMKG